MIRLQDEPLRVDEAVNAVRGDGDGAVAVFVGTVRNVNEGRRVLYLVYEAYPAMATAAMERIAARAAEMFAASRVAILHRTGRLEVGEASVLVAVAGPHRAQALDACRWAIDELKRTVPIWKREHYKGGAVWIEGTRTTPTEEV